MITLKRTSSNDKDFSMLVSQLDNDLRRRYGSTQDEYDQYNHLLNLDTVIVAYENVEAVGCGCFREFDSDAAEVKRMFVAAEHRGKRIGDAILKELEQWAVEKGFHSMVLETGTAQPEAIQLYKKQGYQIIPNYKQYINNELSICMRKIFLI